VAQAADRGAVQQRRQKGAERIRREGNQQCIRAATDPDSRRPRRRLQERERRRAHPFHDLAIDTAA